jgi:hypothetical protein
VGPPPGIRSPPALGTREEPSVSHSVYRVHGKVSVQKVIPTLTSMSTEICLSMAGAKQHNGTGFILVPAVGRMSSRVALEALYCVAPWCLQRGATSMAGEEAKPPGP